MREFHKADPVLTRLLGPQKLRAGSDYLPSPFLFPTELDGKRYWYSTLTKQGLELPPDFTPAGPWTAAQIEADPNLTELMRGWFLKPADRDETKFYESVNAMTRAFYTKKGISSYFILPTTACNARCSYCYEAGIKPVSMRDETVEQTLAYILRSRRPDKKLHLQWFGGEPLLGVGVIDRITEGLREAGVEFRSGFTTNGSLIDDAVIEKMTGPWNTHSVQITLDGTEESYRRIKHYVNCPDAYRRVLRAIGLLSARGVWVSVRLNLDGTNRGEVAGILRDLAEHVTVRDTLWVYASPIYQRRMSEACLPAWEETAEVTQQIVAAGFKTLQQVGLSTKFCITRCMAANPAGNVLITPEGRLSFCQHRLEGPLYGSVTEGITDHAALKAFSVPPPVSEKCRDCPFLPDCTAFQACPVYDRDCKAIRLLRAEPQLHEMIRAAEAKASEAKTAGTKAAEAEAPEEGEQASAQESMEELISLSI